MPRCNVLVGVLAAVLSATVVVGPADADSTPPKVVKLSTAGTPKCC